mgnify:CR=1 FL=1
MPNRLCSLQITPRSTVVHHWLAQRLRQAPELLEVLIQDQPQALDSPIIFNLGNNNALSREQVEQIFEAVKGQPQVIVVNTAVPRPWRDGNNQIIREVAANYPQADVIDWNELSNGRPEYFAPDGVHLVPTGVAGTGAAGTATVDAEANTAVTGVEGTGSVGTVSVSSNADVGVSGVVGTGAAGTVSISLGQTLVPTGVEGTGAAGTVTVDAKATVVVIGVSGTGEIGAFNVWGLVDDSQTPNWSNINDSQTPGWSNISDSQTPNWDEVA